MASSTVRIVIQISGSEFDVAQVTDRKILLRDTRNTPDWRFGVLVFTIDGEDIEYPVILLDEDEA